MAHFWYHLICHCIKYKKEEHAGIAQLIERCLAKAEVAGLSPVSRSIVFKGYIKMAL